MLPEKRKENVPTTLAVHRCRFVDYAPSAITALAFPPLPLPSVNRKRRKTSGKQHLRYGTLAVGHANGNVDLCDWSGSEQSVQCSQAWVVRKVSNCVCRSFFAMLIMQTMPGPYPSKVDSLTFVIRHPDDFDADDVPSISDLRLFSSGGGSELLEWSLEKSYVKRTISSQGGAIWCVATNPASTFLALGCEDGTVRLLSVQNDTLTHFRRFDRVKCRMLSIAWGPPVPKSRAQSPMNENGSDSDFDDDEDDWQDSWLVTGCSDSSLRKWDTKTGRALERMAVDKIRGERTLVWTVGVLGDGTIISGDSLGHVKFWDSRTCTQLHSFQAHGADVLALSINPEGKALYTSGVDQKTVQFSLVRTNAPATSSQTGLRWAQTTSRRMHSHDVRALASWPPYTPLPSNYKRAFPLDIAPILASGGLDMSVVLSPAALPESTLTKVINPLSTSTTSTFGDAYHRRLTYTVGNAIRISRNRRLMLCLREAGLSVWRILPKPEDETADDVQEEDAEPWSGGWEKVLEMNLNVASNLVAGEISEDGRWLAVSDMYEAKLFSLHTDEQDQVSVKRVKDFPALIHTSIPNASSDTSTGAATLCFSPDSSKLVFSAASTSYILIFDLTSEKPRLLRRFEHHRLKEAVIGDRVVKPLKQKQPNGISRNGKHAPDREDVEMEDAEDEITSPESSEESEESDSDDEKNPVADIIPSILRITISPDGQWLATSDDQRHTHIFNLDTISHHCLLPTFPIHVECFAFSPASPSVLFLAFPDNTLQVYDVEARQFPAWSKDLSLSSLSPSPIVKRLVHLHDSILGICFPPPTAGSQTGSDAEKSRYALLWGANWLLKLPLSLSTSNSSPKTSKKRRHAQAVTQEQLDAQDTGVAANEEGLTSFSTKLITHYRPILHADFLSDGELVVVERPLVDVLSTLPPAYFKHKYGAS
ncbi:U3 small nucleolar RNA-associated protein 4 [Leucoagaricus sp. SymC.cos]|nr:U3 small nucleolar RNA-associated protein 4 [Leucoagaricus sp. SymC.cos]